MESDVRYGFRRGPLRPLSIAPMMDRTDRHFRYFLRLLTRRTLLYTEMVHTGAILETDPERLLAYDPVERPLALQLGGENPQALARAATIAEELGYDEVDLNVGCPSPRVQRGRFGVRLMAEPERVAEAVTAMRARVELPVTVKHRIGFDEIDRYEDLARFVEVVAEAGCDRFAVHARKAWLQGLSPRENREIPPLRYQDVYRLKEEFPHLAIEINGGIKTLAEAKLHLEHVDGVMIGRAVVDNPYFLAQADRVIFAGDAPALSREEIVRAMLPHLERNAAQGVPLTVLLRPLMTLFAGQRGSRAWRHGLSELRRTPFDPASILALVPFAPCPVPAHE